MKDKKTLKGVLLAILVANTFFVSGAKSQPQQFPRTVAAFSVHTKLSQEEIFPHEPLTALVVLTNESPDEQKLITKFWIPSLLIRREGENWSEHFGYGYGFGLFTPPPEPTEKIFASGERLTELLTVNIDHEENHILSRPGTYWVHGNYVEVKSSIKKLKVKEPLPKDKRALDYLSENKLSRFFSRDSFLQEYAMAYRNMYKPDEKLQLPDYSMRLSELVRLYPDSRYAQWARLGLFYVRDTPLIYPLFIGSDNIAPENVVPLRQLQAEIEALAPTFVSPIKELAWFEAGITASVLKDTPAADKNFKKAIESGGDANMVERIETFKSLLRSVQAPTPSLDPKLFLNMAIRDLEEKRYDAKGFAEKYPKEYRQLSTIKLQLWERQMRGEITEEEYYRQSAAKFKEYVMKYSQPLSTEEWQRHGTLTPGKGLTDE